MQTGQTVGKTAQGILPSSGPLPPHQMMSKVESQPTGQQFVSQPGIYIVFQLTFSLHQITGKVVYGTLKYVVKICIWPETHDFHKSDR